MADCTKLIPIIIKWEAGVTGEGLTNEELFEKARKKGYANDPADPGGPTMVGITLETFKAYRKSMKKPLPTVNDLKNISFGDGIVGPITLKAINENPHPADLFQRLWNRRKKFFMDIVARSVADYERKIGREATERELLKYTKKRFLKGWLNRLNDFKYED